MDKNSALNVLIIDDDPQVRNLLELIAKETSSRYTSVATTKEGLELYQQNPNLYDIIFTDLNQRPNGLEVAQTIKGHDKSLNPQTSVYIITGSSVTEDASVWLLNAAKGFVGDSHYLEKPIDVDRLIKIMAEEREAKDKRQRQQRRTQRGSFSDLGYIWEHRA